MELRYATNPEDFKGYDTERLRKDFLFQNCFIEDEIKEVSFKESSRVMANWARRSSKGLGYNMRYSMSGIHYNPGIGYEKINDYTSISCKINYGWLPGEGAVLYSHAPAIGIRYMTYVDDGSLMSSSYNIGWSFLTKSQWQGGLDLVQNIENLRDSLNLEEDETFVTPGKYKFVNFKGSLVCLQTKVAPFKVII